MTRILQVSWVFAWWSWRFTKFEFTFGDLAAEKMFQLLACNFTLKFRRFTLALSCVKTTRAENMPSRHCHFVVRGWKESWCESEVCLLVFPRRTCWLVWFGLFVLGCRVRCENLPIVSYTCVTSHYPSTLVTFFSFLVPSPFWKGINLTSTNELIACVAPRPAPPLSELDAWRAFARMMSNPPPCSVIIIPH